MTRRTRARLILGVFGILAIGSLVVCVGSGPYLTYLAKKRVEDEIKLADQLWDQGERAAAVKFYERLVDKDFKRISDSDRSAILQRCIDYEVESHDPDIAADLMFWAVLHDVPISLNTPESNVMHERAVRLRESMEPLLSRQ